MDGDREVAETAAVLFADVVGSTALRTRLGEDAADALVEVQEQLLTRAVRASDGTVVKLTGDGLLATFPAAASAVGAGVEVQQVVHAHGLAEPERAFAVRVGVSSGDVQRRDGDVHGITVVEAARLCDAAEAGQVLVADVVRLLARDRGGHPFRPLGERVLKGLPAPLAVSEVVWEPDGRLHPAGVRGGAGDAPGWPAGAAPSGVLPPGSLLGRDDDVARLRDRCTTSRLVTLLGAGGAGKTSLAAAVAPSVAGELGVQPVWVDLQPVDDPERVVPTLADALAANPPPAADDPPAALAAELTAREVLLVLDNCEQVIGAVADVLDALVVACPGVRVLTTSRETDRPT